MKMENQTKRIALLIAVATMGAAQAAHDEAKKGTGQVAGHHVVSGHITSGHTKTPFYSRRSSGVVSGDTAARTKLQRSVLQHLHRKPQRSVLQHLHDVIQMGSLDRVKFVLKAVNINDKDTVGKTPVHYALGQPEIMEFLIAQGADVKSQDNWGYTPLHYAVRDGYEDVIFILLDAGADVNATEFTGRTPLDLAVRHKKMRAANLLRSKGGRTGKGPSRMVASGRTARYVSDSKK